jgi:hypothetical protein
MSIRVEWRGDAFQDFDSIGKAMETIRAVFPEAYYRAWQTVGTTRLLSVWDSRDNEAEKQQPVARIVREQPVEGG